MKGHLLELSVPVDPVLPLPPRALTDPVGERERSSTTLKKGLDACHKDHVDSNKARNGGRPKGISTNGPGERRRSYPKEWQT